MRDFEPYVVHGSTGKHEDFRDWPVAAFTSRRRAETWACRANAWATKNGVGWGSHPAWERRDEVLGTNPYDPDMRVAYTGVRYGVRQANHVPLDPPLPK